ncbi:argininosuccinate lyase [Alicyclobacillus tolerans]|uniref:Argininosuccinate lyase n=1 Tax=Alicyclobacillus tolerans TaxID=90970 RepID=A0ABT9LVN9_9BACL|nr:argininosuccinate lyase [Alicyclobacillus tengchongensis]MDP9728320.1 argininosuccinate lyase [Alicyclobacillus tengchongensis]
MKLWGGRFTEATHHLVETYTASISFDKRLAVADVTGSLAHVQMLASVGVLTNSEAETIQSGLQEIVEEIKTDNFPYRIEDEDIHMNIERRLTEKIGPLAGKLHTARSRNDQVALDMHLYMREVLQTILNELHLLMQALVTTAEEYLDVIFPGYTHLQRAQPVLFAHHLLAYFWMFQRDAHRFRDALKRTDCLPLGAGALAGTTFPVNRQQVAEILGFSTVYPNSMDAVSDRDYLLEFLSHASICMMHLSRLAEEMILWTSEEFGYIELADRYCTGSSMMPQKKNPDVPELVRGKTGRVYGHLIGLLTVLKGLPLAYNKDLQEDKEGIFDTIDTLIPALQLFTGIISTLSVRRDRLQKALSRDFSAATDVADELVRMGIPFRQAHALVGKWVQRALEQGLTLATLPLEEYQKDCPELDDRVFEWLDIRRVVEARTSYGGTATVAVKQQLLEAKATLQSFL